MCEETIALQVDDVHRVAGGVEVRYADDDDDQRQGDDGPLDACRVLDHSEEGAEDRNGNREHEEGVAPHQVQVDRRIEVCGVLRMGRYERVHEQCRGDRHQNAQQNI